MLPLPEIKLMKSLKDMTMNSKVMMGCASVFKDILMHILYINLPIIILSLVLLIITPIQKCLEIHAVEQAHHCIVNMLRQLLMKLNVPHPELLRHRSAPRKGSEIKRLNRVSRSFIDLSSNDNKLAESVKNTKKLISKAVTDPTKATRATESLNALEKEIENVKQLQNVNAKNNASIVSSLWNNGGSENNTEKSESHANNHDDEMIRSKKEKETLEMLGNEFTSSDDIPQKSMVADVIENGNEQWRSISKRVNKMMGNETPHDILLEELEFYSEE